MGGKVLAALKGGTQNCSGGRGGAKSLHPLKGGGAQKVLPCLEVGGTKKFDFPIL